MLPALVCALAPALFAQNALYTEYAGQMCLVRGADGLRPVVEQGGRRELGDASRLALEPAEEFLPVFLSVREVHLSIGRITPKSAPTPFTSVLSYQAQFQSPVACDSVFVVLDVRGAFGGRTLSLREVGRLAAGVPQTVMLAVPLAFSFGPGRYYLHVFAGGAELLHSEIPDQEREAALDRMVAKRVASLAAAGLKLFVGPPPEYPEALRKSAVKGHAVVAMRVTAQGRPVDLVVKAATDPAFGEAAVAAVRQWRFLPKVRNGQPVETPAEIPFEFAPPAQAAK